MSLESLEGRKEGTWVEEKQVSGKPKRVSTKTPKRGTFFEENEDFYSLMAAKSQKTRKTKFQEETDPRSGIKRIIGTD